VSLDPLYRVIGWMLAAFYVPTHNLGVATIMLTIVIMLVQFPLTAKQARSMIQMQRVQPEIKKIQQKYKDDKAKQNEELLKFYQENKINPLAGCLPMIITIPIGIAVFRTFSKGVQHHLPQTPGPLGDLYRGICGTLNTKACGVRLTALTAKGHTPPALHFLGMSLNLTAHSAQAAGIGSAIPYYILIALVALTGWYQVRQTQAKQLQSGNAPANAQMQAMTKVFPVFFAFICLGLNAGATLYFVVSNIWRIGQQQLVLGKLYDQGVASGQIKPAEKDEPPPKDTNGKGNANGNGKAKSGDTKPGETKAGDTKPGDKGSDAKASDGKASNGNNSNGDAKPQGMTPGARRKKRKR
jgi:YidC/Oxa1 family membrane protein insertase